MKKPEDRNIKAVDFYYFTGTGNTLLIVHKMRDTFTEKGVKVTVNKIEKTVSGKINPENTIGLAFPVAIFTTYPLVWDFVKSMPEVKGTPVFMVDTFGGLSFGVVGHLKNVLRKKGYRVIGAKQIQMPINVFIVMPDDWSRKRIEKGYETARLYTEDILAGKSSWKSFPLLSGLMYYLCIGVFKITDWKIHQKYLHMKVETVKCNSCGICAEFCPANNIQMEQYPVHGFKCQYCLRCASVCPQGAIPGFINYKKVVYKLPDNSLEELLRHDE